MTKNNFFLAFNLNLIWVRFYFDERRSNVLILENCVVDKSRFTKEYSKRN